jgi:hypothetical protein
MKTARDAQRISFAATLLCPIMAIPAILMGGIARSTGGDLYHSFIKIAKVIDWLNQKIGPMEPITDSTSRPPINQSKFFHSSCNI